MDLEKHIRRITSEEYLLEVAAQLEREGFTSDLLNGMVCERMARQAAEINKQGLVAQLRFLGVEAGELFLTNPGEVPPDDAR